jgi:hypothetical protein
MLALVTNNDELGLSGEVGGSICDMESLGAMDLIALLIAVAIIAATCGFIASAATHRNKRRARGFFVLGFLCGLMTGVIRRRRRRGLTGRVVTIAPWTIRLRQLAAAGTGLFHDATSSSTYLLHRPYWVWARQLRRSTRREHQPRALG